MAERRMFSKSIIDSDLFLDMPSSTQILYFHLGMRADDDGFVNSPQKIMRMVSCSKNDMDMLIFKNFIIPFETGVCVIKHWRIHNYIRGDRYTPTIYTEEKTMLMIDDSKSYTFGLPVGLPHDIPNVGSGLPDGIPVGDVGKVRLGKVSIGKVSEEKTVEICVFESYTSNQELIETLNSFIEFRKKIKSPMTEHAVKLLLGNLDKISKIDDEKIEILNQSIVNGWKGLFELKSHNRVLEQPYPKAVGQVSVANIDETKEFLAEMERAAEAKRQRLARQKGDNT